MKLFRNLTLAATVAMASFGSANAAWTFNTTTNAADLILGIRATAGQGSTTNLFYNLGSSTTFRDGGGRGLVGNISTDLIATFGAGWATRTDLFFGVIGNRTNVSGADPDGAGPMDAGRVLYLSRNASAPGEAALYPQGSNNSNSTMATSYDGLKLGLATLSETAQGNNVASLDISNTSTADGNAILNSFTAKTTSGAGSDRAFNGVASADFLGSVGNSVTTNYIDIQRIGVQGNSQPTSYVGTVSFDNLGNVSIVPEPSSLLLIGAAGVASLLRRRREQA